MPTTLLSFKGEEEADVRAGLSFCFPASFPCVSCILAPGFEVDFTEPLCLSVWLKGGIVRLMRDARRSEKAALCLGVHCSSCGGLVFGELSPLFCQQQPKS